MTQEAYGGGRDRLRELLDAVLDEDNRTLGDMAGDAYSSPYHFNRQLSRGAGEPPVAMRRRVMLERAAWQLRHGASVTDVAFAAGYESVEGFSRAFSRAFGHPPSTVRAGEDRTTHWLPAPNGIHFHPPTSLWIDSRAGRAAPAASEVTALLARHDDVAPRWLATVRDIERRGAWDDRLVDALCDPPESFVLGSVVAHVLTFAAHRRQVVRQLLRAQGVEVDHGDPIEWLRRRSGGIA
jgi:AraC-like DNA-binding protein